MKFTQEAVDAFFADDIKDKVAVVAGKDRKWYDKIHGTKLARNMARAKRSEYDQLKGHTREIGNLYSRTVDEIDESLSLKDAQGNKIVRRPPGWYKPVSVRLTVTDLPESVLGVLDKNGRAELKLWLKEKDAKKTVMQVMEYEEKRKKVGHWIREATPRLKRTVDDDDVENNDDVLLNGTDAVKNLIIVPAAAHDVTPMMPEDPKDQEELKATQAQFVLAPDRDSTADVALKGPPSKRAKIDHDDCSSAGSSSKAKGFAASHKDPDRLYHLLDTVDTQGNDGTTQTIGLPEPHPYGRQPSVSSIDSDYLELLEELGGL